MQTITARFARRFRILRLLRVSLAAGAAYDLLIAAVLAAVPALPAKFLGLPVPEEIFYLWCLAVQLVMLAGLSLFAAYDPRRYSAIILVAILGRLAGAAVMAAAALGQPELAGLYLPAALELTLGVLHVLFWLPVYS